MSWLLEKYHHRPCVRKGDTEDETIIVQNKIFSTKNEALNYMKDLKSKTYVRLEEDDYKSNGRGFKRWFVHLGKHWVNENTGDDHEEYYCWILKKA